MEFQFRTSRNRSGTPRVHGRRGPDSGSESSPSAQSSSATSPTGTAFVSTNGVPAVPEPATWATMLMGLFSVAALLRQHAARRAFGPAAAPELSPA